MIPSLIQRTSRFIDWAISFFNLVNPAAFRHSRIMSVQRKPSLPFTRRRRIVALLGLTVGFLNLHLSGQTVNSAKAAAAHFPPGIVDMHCHIAGIGAGGSGCFVAPGLLHNWRFSFYLRSFGVSLRELREHGDTLVADRISERLAGSQYVHQAVVLALDGVVDATGNLDTNHTEVYVPNEFVDAVVRQHTNLLFGASVNPYRPDALARVEWAKAHGAVLVKWIPPIMEIDPADPRLVPFYRKLVQLGLPLLSHTGREKSFSRAAADFGDPDRLRLPLSLGVTVVAAHLASSAEYQGERGPDRLARLMGEYPRLYSDISALTLVNKPGALREAVTRPEFAGRLLYGSDYPLVNTPLVSPWYYLRLSLRQKLRVSHAKNPWDRDVLLKRALGVSPDTFARPSHLLSPAS